MWLEDNPTRKDDRLAYHNKKRILCSHGVAYKEIITPSYAKLKESAGSESCYAELKKIIDQQGGCEGLLDVAKVWISEDTILTLYVSKGTDRFYLSEINHAAYCGCEGCQDRMDTWPRNKKEA